MTTSAKLKKSHNEAEHSAIIGLYRLIARLFSSELDSEAIQQLRHPEIVEMLEKVEPGVSKWLQTIDSDSAAVDYCDLFILPGDKHLSARAIAWLDEGGDITADGIHAVVYTLVDQLNVDISEPPFNGLAHDHIGLLFHIAAQLREQNSSQAEEFERIAIYSWVKDLGERLQQSNSPIYRALGVIVCSS